MHEHGLDHFGSSKAKNNVSVRCRRLLIWIRPSDGVELTIDSSQDDYLPVCTRRVQPEIETCDLFGRATQLDRAMATWIGGFAEFERAMVVERV
jgi:hypothetical protein